MLDHPPPISTRKSHNEAPPVCRKQLQYNTAWNGITQFCVNYCTTRHFFFPAQVFGRVCSNVSRITIPHFAYHLADINSLSIRINAMYRTFGNAVGVCVYSTQSYASKTVKQPMGIINRLP